MKKSSTVAAGMLVLTLTALPFMGAQAAKPEKPGQSGAPGNSEAPGNTEAPGNSGENGKPESKGKPALEPARCLDGSESNGNGNSRVCNDLPAPQALTAKASGAGSVELSFQYAGPAEAPAKFQIERDGQSIGSTYALSFTDTGVSPGVHVYRVRPMAKTGKGRTTAIHRGPFAQASVKLGQVCEASPAVSVSVTPTRIWPPNKKMVDVTVSGSVTQGEGCALIGAGFSLIDEYGANQSGSLGVGANGGSFSQTIQVEAWRNGDDFDGRNYTITVNALNSAGEAAKSAIVLVPHDQR